MTKEELLKQLKKENESIVAKLNPTTMGTYARSMGYSDGLDYAVGLVEKLDEPKKVVIPQLIADWIENDLDYVGKEPVNIVRGVVEDGDCGPRGEWLDSIDNQKLLLNAIANGYEVEKEPKYFVRIKGFPRFTDSQYLNYRTCDGTFELDSKLEAEHVKTTFTKSWLKDNWPRYDDYSDAGLLEFEEVKDDE